MVATTIIEHYDAFDIIVLLSYGVEAILIILVIYVLILVIKALKKYLNS